MALPPGPRTPGIFAILRWMLWPVETFEKGFAEWGDLYSVNNPLYGREVVVADPELIRQIFSGDPEVFLGGEPNRALEPIVGAHSVLLLDGAAHHRQRKLLMPPFHGDRLAAYADVVHDIAARVSDGWPTDEPLRVLPSMQRITFDLILEAVFGLREGAELEAVRERVLATVENVQSPLGMVWLMPAFQRDLGPLTGWAAHKRRIAAIDEVLFAVVAEARAAVAAGRRRTDVLSLLVAARDERGEAMSDAELRDELVTLLLAGYETTATALAWALDEILRRPQVLGRILDEIGAASAEVHRAPLPYLDATIKEVLRLRPLAPLLVRRVTTPIRLRDYELPAGTIVVPCVYLAHRHPAHWEAPNELRPERFLDKKPDAYTWFPFGGGARRCIGMQLALLELRVVLATLLSRLRLRAHGKAARVSLRSFLFAPSTGTTIVVEGGRARAAA